MVQIHQPPHNKIVLKGSYTEGGVEQEEGILATAPALPGMNVVMTTAAQSIKRDTYAPGATPASTTATTTAGINVVTELLNVLEGKTIDDAYAVGSQFSFFKPKKGDIIQVLALSGETVLKAGLLSANAAGKWITAATAGVVQAMEASGGALAADTLIRVRVL